MTTRTRFIAVVAATSLLAATGTAQGPGRGFPGGFGGPGGQQERPVVAQVDKDGDGRLNAAERREARRWLESQPARGPRGPWGRGGFGGWRGGGGPAGSPGERLTPAGVKTYGSKPLYDPAVLRTLFFQFENDDWEAELEAFNDTDVEVPATLTVDGRIYRDVGLHFRGASSLFSVPMGLKRSLNVSLDWVHGRQGLGGYDWKTLGPLAQQYQRLIAEDVRKDTRKLDTFEAFEAGVDALRTFAERRRAYLLNDRAR